MKNISIFIKKIFVVAAFGTLVIGFPFYAAHAAPGGAIEPSVSKGITILPLEQHPVPDMLKTQAKLELSQMKERGYMDATEGSVSYLDRAREDNDKRLKSMADVSSKLKIVPANIDSSALGRAVLLGVSANGGHTEEGWTGLNRLFIVPKLGLVGLNEVDYLASGGGMAFIKEAINQDVNGFPAILSVKQSRSDKGLSELTWATDQKIFTLSVNRALKTKKSIDSLLEVARNIF